MKDDIADGSNRLWGVVVMLCFLKHEVFMIEGIWT